MKATRKLIAIGMCGIMLGGVSSVMTASTASARMYNCDQRVENREKNAANDHRSGKITSAEYLQVQDDIASQRERWGC